MFCFVFNFHQWTLFFVKINHKQRRASRKRESQYYQSVTSSLKHIWPVKVINHLVKGSFIAYNSSTECMLLPDSTKLFSVIVRKLVLQFNLSWHLKRKYFKKQVCISPSVNHFLMPQMFNEGYVSWQFPLSLGIKIVAALNTETYTRVESILFWIVPPVH